MSNREMPKPPVLEKQEVDQPQESPVPQVKPRVSGIEVVALRAGFFKNSRKSEGDRFMVPSMEKVGTWMKCVDPKAEAEHQKMMKDKKHNRVAGR